jgi:transcriptional regulator with XRE-family HTH domain
MTGNMDRTVRHASPLFTSNVDNDLGGKASQISRWLIEARGDIPKARAALRIGVSEKTLARWESGATSPDGKLLMKAAEVYGRSLNELDGLLSGKMDTSVPRGTGGNVLRDRAAVRETAPEYVASEDSWSPNPALVSKIPKRAYDVAIAYCRRLQSSDWPKDEIEQIERLMIDPRYAQANKRKGHELSEDDHIMLIDATWEAVKHTAAALGRQV